MTETTGTSGQPTTDGSPAAARGSRGGLSTMLLPELRQLATSLGLKTSGVRKGELVDAIRAVQSATPRAERPASAGTTARDDAADQRRGQDSPPAGETAGARRPEVASGRDSDAAREQRPDQSSDQASDHGADHGADNGADRGSGRGSKQRAQGSGQKPDQSAGTGSTTRSDTGADSRGDQRQRHQENGQSNQSGQSNQGGQSNQNGQTNQNGQSGQSGQGAQSGQDGEEEGGSRRNRRRRGRDRANQTGTGSQGGPSNPSNQGGQSNQSNQAHQGGQSGGHGNRRNEPDLQILEDDVLAPCAGILDLMDNYAFVRTSGYLPGTDDVYVSMSLVRKFGLRRGDAVTGQVRQPREGERREKYNPLVKIDSVNGAEPDAARTRPEFADLTPVHPSARLRLETSPSETTGRVVDLVAPLGKGQRALVISPDGGGKTTLLRTVAAAVTANNPECHLMVVLLDERPEEVTDFQRSVKGEVISSTFDRPPGDHTVVAELAIERAKRLVELGHDVVVLVDGLTRLGRAYHLSAPTGSRALPGGVDPASLYPPKRFFGAARSIEDGGSLTVIGTLTVESGSAVDELVLEELTGTANSEIRLRRDLADQRRGCAVDPLASGTRHEETLLPREELAAVTVVREQLAGLGALEAAARLDERLTGSATNLELLRRSHATSGAPR